MDLLLTTNLSATVDIVALIFVGVFALWGLIRGFTKTFFSAFGTMLSLLFAVLLCSTVANFLQEKFALVTTISESVSVASYRTAVERMQGKRLVIRTLDVGADKQIPYFELPKEENPALGFRAVRICLAREAVFKTQLRAILRASAFGTVSIMIPMIVSAEEIRDCRRLLEECKAELLGEGQAYDANIEFGIMIETPAAAIMSDELAEEVDFFSVGTNDLTQYTLAADRQNPELDNLCERNREPILRLIQRSADAIHQSGGWIGICGELAADLRLTQRFADMKIDELSVSVPYLLGVREKVIECK